MDADVVLRSQRGGHPSRGKVKNISAEGILITSERPFQVGAVLLIEVLSTADKNAGLEPMRATFELLRIGGEGPFELGGRFIDLHLP